MAPELDDNGLLKSAPDTIYTFTGRWIRPLDPDPADIHIQDIAHALSQQCRWTGHTREFYSVAEHSILAAMMVPMHLRLAALLHDASEAYLADLARPIKHAPGLGEEYRSVEWVLEAAIAARFGTVTDPLSLAPIKRADEAMLWREAKVLLPELGRLMPDPPKDTPTPYCWLPQEAEARFLDAFRRYAPCSTPRRENA